jgi:hypothetical protein
MCLLTDEQLKIVTKDVKNEGINYSHLNIDLVDHICCDIEQHMEQGISFENAYEKVKVEFGIKGLRQIQQDTLMLIDKNYRIMKNSMKMIGVIALALMAFGALFKIMHWPFAGPMLILSFVFIIAVFFPTLLYIMYKEMSQKKQAAIYVVAFFSGTAFMAGILFKIMHWPGAGPLLFAGISLITYVLIPLIIVTRTKKIKMSKPAFLTGLLAMMIFLTGLFFKIMHWPGAIVLLTFGGAVLVVVFIPLFYYSEVRKSEKIRIDFLFAIIAFTYFIVFNFLLNLSGENALLDDLNLQDKSYQETTDFLDAKNRILINELNNDTANQLHTRADVLCKELDELKTRLIQNHYKITKEEAVTFIKNNYAIHDLQPVTFFSGEAGKTPFSELKTNMEEFNKLYAQLLNDSLQVKLKSNSILNVEPRYNEYIKKDLPWEVHYLEDLPPTGALSTLSFIQYNIRLTENIALTTLINDPKNK